MNFPQFPLAPLLLLGGLALGPQEHAPALTENPVAKVADRYLAVAFGERNKAKAAAFMHEDITFIDPTAEVWPGSQAAKGVRGRDRFIALQSSWQIEEASFEQTAGFESGKFALRAGKLSWKSVGSPGFKDVPFIMMLEIEDGLIRSRTDFGDYDEIVPGIPSKTEELKLIGAEFLDAYGTFDEEIIGGLYSDEAVFTEVHPDGVTVRGRREVLEYLKTVSASISDLKLKLEPTIVSYQHMFYTGRASFGLDTDGPQTPGGIHPVDVPFWLMLKIVDGEIVEQRDYTGLDHLSACLRPSGKH